MAAHAVAPRTNTKSQSTRSGSSGPLEHAMADASRDHEAGSMGQREARTHNIPATIPLHSINGQFKGTFHLHEYLGTSSSSSPYTRLQACVTEENSSTRITPREAEARAGKGSRKSWKLTLMTMHAGQQMTLQKYFILLGVEKPRESTSEPSEQPPEQLTKRCAWAPSSAEGNAEPHSKRQHSDCHEMGMGRRNTDESGTGALRLDYRRDSMTALSLGSHRDSAYPELRAFSSHAELAMAPRMNEQRYAGLQPNHGPPQLSAPLSVPLSAFATRAASAGIELGSAYLGSSAMASTMNRETSADMETLLRSYELSKRLSTATAAANTLSLPAGTNNLQLHGLSSHELDKWSMPQTAMLVQNSRLFPVQTVLAGGSTCLSSVPALNRWLPVGTCILQQGFGPSSFSLPLQEPSRQFQPLQEPSRQFQPLQESSRQFQPLQEPSRQFQPLQEPSRQFQPLQESSRQFQPLQESSRQFQISAEAASQYGSRYQISRPPPLVSSSHRQSETNSAPTLSELNHGSGHTPRFAQTTSIPRLSYTDPVKPEGHELHAPSMPGLRQAMPSGHPHPAIDQPDLSRVPTTIPIFTPNHEVRGTLHLHEYIAGTLTRPNRPPPCVVLAESEDTGPSRAMSEEVRVTPRTAEAKAGREARKNWKETFRTLHEGRVISLKAFFAVHNIN